MVRAPPAHVAQRWEAWSPSTRGTPAVDFVDAATLVFEQWASDVGLEVTFASFQPAFCPGPSGFEVRHGREVRRCRGGPIPPCVGPPRRSGAPRRRAYPLAASAIASTSTSASRTEIGTSCRQQAAQPARHEMLWPSACARAVATVERAAVMARAGATSGCGGTGPIDTSVSTTNSWPSTVRCTRAVSVRGGPMVAGLAAPTARGRGCTSQGRSRATASGARRRSPPRPALGGSGRLRRGDSGKDSLSRSALVPSRHWLRTSFPADRRVTRPAEQ